MAFWGQLIWLGRADFAASLSHPHSVKSFRYTENRPCWEYGKSMEISTMEISKCCKSGFLFLRVVGPAFSSWTEKNVRKTIVTPLVLYYCLDCVSTLMAQMVVTVMNPPAMQETWVQFLGREDPLEKEIETHASILAWRIPWTKESDGLQSMGSHRVRHDWTTNTDTYLSQLSLLLWVGLYPPKFICCGPKNMTVFEDSF